MKADRKALAVLFARLHALGVTSADVGCSVCKGTDTKGKCWRCYGDGYDHVSSGAVLQVLGEMMVTDTLGITTTDVLAAAKRAGVF